MEIDFLIRKNKVTSRHNIVPLEVKSSQRYTLSSLKKCIEKYNNYITSPCVVHTADLKEENGILFLPLYIILPAINTIVSMQADMGSM